jgi:hypothetical protein
MGSIAIFESPQRHQRSAKRGVNRIDEWFEVGQPAGQLETQGDTWTKVAQTAGANSRTPPQV